MSHHPTTVGPYQHKLLKKALVHGGEVTGCDHKAPMRHHMQKPLKTIDCLCKTNPTNSGQLWTTLEFSPIYSKVVRLYL